MKVDEQETKVKLFFFSLINELEFCYYYYGKN